MNISRIALAALFVVTGAAQAQNAVTIYGSFDGGVRYTKNADAAGHSRITNSSTGTYNSNRLGFKGVEDLGNGLNAHFTLEAGLNSGTGAPQDAARLFNRSTFVGLGGTWGSLDLGRQYTVAFKTVAAYDPFNYKYTGIIPASLASISAGTRNDNDIQYAGTFGPLTARAEYALGEQPGVGANNRALAVGATYAAGPVSVGAAYTRRKPAVVAATATAPANYQDNTDYTVGGALTFGPWRAAAGYARESQDTVSGGSIVQKNAWIGGSYDLTPALGLTAAYYDTRANGLGTSGNGSGKRGLFIVGATYALSKRTNLYADIDYAKFSGTLATAATGTTAAAMAGLNGSGSQLPLASAPGQDKQLGVSLGVNHLF